MASSLYAEIFREPSRQEIRDFLLGIPLFTGLKRSEVGHLARLMFKRTFKEGEIIFVEKDIGSAMYIIMNGKVSILKQAGKKVKPVAHLSNGSFFGEMALLTDAQRSATARADAKTELLVFFKKDLEHVLEEDPAMGLKLMRKLAEVLAQRLQHAITQLEGSGR
ncbi:MAG TPA: cyclic nucleotide-binding domain-containing protein [Candidatus Nanoarchaeia archaeon]|nr:cyclic nucleotide-binding domain-containing protein [Candidatus Nanoarchaeia archaeon]